MPASALTALNVNSFFPEDLKKAKIYVLKENGSVDPGRTVSVLFNPSEYRLTDEANYSQIKIPWMDSPFVIYDGGSASTLNMELFFDTSAVLTAKFLNNKAATDVSEKVKQITELVYIDGSQHAPPVVKFVWGSLSFLGVITQVNSTYTKFTEEGMPVQARLDVSFLAVMEKNHKRRSPFESPDRTKCRTVREDYSIWDIAVSEYGDVSKWKIIAKANGITNPLEIALGTVLKIPAL